MKLATAGTKGYRLFIPPITARIEFESVARLSSFTVAENELGVTQAAVSRQVANRRPGVSEEGRKINLHTLTDDDRLRSFKTQ